MPHLEEPMELGAGVSWQRRLLRFVLITVVTSAVFIFGLAVVVVAVTE
jgi:hypothetical protein